MAASFHMQRLAQRSLLSAVRPSRTEARHSLFSTGACIFCQLRPRAWAAQTARGPSLTLPTRRLASASSSTTAPETSNQDSNLPDLTNHYTIFRETLPAGPPPASSFDIPLSDLRREFLRLQNVIHPDKFPPGPAKQRAEALSARINEAYRTLSDPLQRAQYLLREMHGIDVTAEDGATQHALDPETLMEVMEVQERIEEVGADPEAEGTIAALKKENDARVTACVKSLAQAFERGDIEAARQECVRLRFWYSVGEGLREWEPGRTEIRLIH
ncbi:J-type chaperone JAC1 [Aspergillus fischeri NRRL 181]|uniref:DnaJ domain protein n=1 Tax=Neosartorya fischeri (strain ATCC 1020 / DSM 3700 / CBS 544.65 / FGSC A1164 / JCM 1740 / NRRL 181 / WB 181) TaxID=331117 RepID=A1DB72_NEOFI|nr:DnaJ domain protein [Aspergillus fischeri NRRL 181]EAW20112.1 DnaJ domain protein [Aspergillus fischeri NRRL 181]